MGTTLVALKYNGGVLFASDSFMTSGSYIFSRSSKKVLEVSPSPQKFGSIKVIKCGTAAHSQMVSRYVFNYLNYHSMELQNGQELKIETVVTLYKNIIYNNKNSLSCAFIITNGKKIYTVSVGGAYVDHELMALRGSGSTFI